MADETLKSNEARNYLFEATVAAMAHHPDQGVEAILNAKSDTGIRANGNEIWVECKRIQSLGSIKKNAKEASKQLEKLFAEKVGSGHRGIIALDISKILNLSNKTFSAENDQELVRSARLMMDQFIYQNSQIWQKDFERRNEKIIGAIIRFAFMYHSKIRNIPVYTSQWAMNPRLSIDASDEQIQRQLVMALR